MSGRRDLIELEDRERTELQLSEAFTWRELAGEALRSSGLYGGITLAIAVVMTVLIGFIGVPNTTLPRTWEYVTTRLAGGLPELAVVSAIMVALVAIIAFVASAWRRWRLATRYRVAVEDGELRFYEKGALLERPALAESTETILKFQKNRISDPNLETSLSDDASHEITVMTEDGMYTFAEGLGEQEADRVVERLERRVFGESG